MGYPYEVEAFVPDGHDGYHYVQVYAGHSLARALLCAFKARREGSECVRVMWR